MPKPGYITASVFNSVMTAKVGKTVIKECCRIACERLGVRDLAEQFDLSGLRALEWGIENEGLAVAAYEADRFTSIHSRGVFHRVPGLMVGGTPDGLVGDDGVVEIKCPNSDNHLLNLTSQATQLDTYWNQIQAYLWITDRRWCDFISFDPRFPEDLQLGVIRVDRCEDSIERIRERAKEMERMITDMVRTARPELHTNGRAR